MQCIQSQYFLNIFIAIFLPVTLLQEEIQWVDIPGGNTKHSFRAEGNPRDYIVGISRQLPKSEISSGIKWAPCIYTRDTGNIYKKKNQSERC